MLVLGVCENWNHRSVWISVLCWHKFHLLQINSSEIIACPPLLFFFFKKQYSNRFWSFWARKPPAYNECVLSEYVLFLALYCSTLWVMFSFHFTGFISLAYRKDLVFLKDHCAFFFIPNARYALYFSLIQLNVTLDCLFWIKYLILTQDSDNIIFAAYKYSGQL